MPFSSFYVAVCFFLSSCDGSLSLLLLSFCAAVCLFLCPSGCPLLVSWISSHTKICSSAYRSGRCSVLLLSTCRALSVSSVLDPPVPFRPISSQAHFLDFRRLRIYVTHTNCVFTYFFEAYSSCTVIAQKPELAPGQPPLGHQSIFQNMKTWSRSSIATIVSRCCGYTTSVLVV